MKEIKVLYEDKYLILCEKPAGMPSQPDMSGQDDCQSCLLQKYPTVMLVHRLDTPTGGVMVFAKDKKTAGKLSSLVQNHDIDGVFGMAKTYLAVLPGDPQFCEGEIKDLLFHDKQKNKSFVAEKERKGVKQASLIWKRIAQSSDGKLLIAVHLQTGRTHQIRVQFSSRGYPLCGDGKYGSRVKCPFIALWSYSLSFIHPITKERISGVSIPDTECGIWQEFSLDNISI